MAIPTTLLAYHQQREAALTNRKVDALNQLQKIQLETLPAARKISDDLTAKSADLSQTIASLQQAILQAPTKGDADALTLKLEKAQVDLRSAAAGQLEAQRSIATLTQDQTSQSDAINALTAAISASKAAQGTAALREKRIKDTTDAFNNDPLKTLGADVTTALTGVAAADTRIQGDVPAALLTRAFERRTAVVQDQKNAKAAASAAQALSANKLREASVQADADLIAFATLASSRLESSKATLSLVVNPATAPLTAEEKSRLADATLVAAAATAMPAEKTRDDARAALSAKQAVLDDAILQARNTDIDVDLTTVQAVTDATKDRDDAQKDFDKAVTDFTPAMQDDLHRWESALPQANWDLVHQLEEAKATLNELQAASLVAMTGAIATAEKAWVADLFARDKADRTSDWIDALVKSRASALEFETNANRQRRFTALRGDL
jgi:hypothetical protein